MIHLSVTISGWNLQYRTTTVQRLKSYKLSLVDALAKYIRTRIRTRQGMFSPAANQSVTTSGWNMPRHGLITPVHFFKLCALRFRAFLMPPAGLQDSFCSRCRVFERIAIQMMTLLGVPVLFILWRKNPQSVGVCTLRPARAVPVVHYKSRYRYPILWVTFLFGCASDYCLYETRIANCWPTVCPIRGQVHSRTWRCAAIPYPGSGVG
jgi:hypothetical protein